MAKNPKQNIPEEVHRKASLLSRALMDMPPQTQEDMVVERMGNAKVRSSKVRSKKIRSKRKKESGETGRIDSKGG